VPAGRALPAFVLSCDFSPWLPRAHPMYRSGTSIHDLHRGHFAVTRPVGVSTLMIALRIVTSPAARTTTLSLHTGQGVVGSI
jgi:hypothetical protein